MMSLVCHQTVQILFYSGQFSFDHSLTYNYLHLTSWRFEGLLVKLWLNWIKYKTIETEKPVNEKVCPDL